VKPAVKAPEKKAAPAPAPAPAAPVAKPAAPAKPAKPSSKAPVTIPKGKVSTGPKTGTPRRVAEEEGATIEIAKGPVKMTPFLKKQKQRLIELRDAYMNSIEGVASETMGGGGDSSAFGMHQADAGSDAYDRDFALSLLGKEQDALYEINEALKRIDNGTYGICEGTGEKIMEERLEAMPFARYGIKWQEKIEREGRRNSWNRPVHSLFGLDDGADDDKDDDKDEEETTTSSSNSNNSGESLDFSKE
jgi:RNA polymerase-binding transcription factor DksA